MLDFFFSHMLDLVLHLHSAIEANRDPRLPNNPHVGFLREVTRHSGEGLFLTHCDGNSSYYRKATLPSSSASPRPLLPRLPRLRRRLRCCPPPPLTLINLTVATAIFSSPHHRPPSTSFPTPLNGVPAPPCPLSTQPSPPSGRPPDLLLYGQ